MKLLLLNGPPGCGKDTIGRLIQEEVGRRAANPYPYAPNRYALIEKFAQPIRDAAIATFPYLNEGNLDDEKDKLIPGEKITLRKWMIAFSEGLMKQSCGDTIFGKLLINRLDAWEYGVPFCPRVIITDCGFEPEVNYLLSGFRVTEAHVVRIHRDGCSFKQDSRGYIAPKLTTTTLEVHNPENHPEDAVEVILTATKFAESLNQ